MEEGGLDYPERVLQIGEGRFLRGFADWIIHQLNQMGIFQGRVVVVAPRPSGSENVRMLNRQDGLFTVGLQGIEDGQTVNRREIVTSVSRALDPGQNWESFLACAEDPKIAVIISNTTEAGIAYESESYIAGQCPKAFPAKIAAYLYHRYRHFSGALEAGVTVLPTELIHHNGDALRALVQRYAEDWSLPSAFIDWLAEANDFCNTLVDRIVTGFPPDIDRGQVFAELGYEDAFYTVAEPFYLWAIEAGARLQALWPGARLPRGVRFVEDVTPYERIKVRILNGAHTAMYPLAWLSKVPTVAEGMNDAILGPFVERLVLEEVIPAVADPALKPRDGLDGGPFSPSQLREYAATTFERFRNPFLRHQIASLGLNNRAKIRARILPSLVDYAARFGEAPPKLAFSLAAHWLVERCQATDSAEDDIEAAMKKVQAAWDHTALAAGVESWLGPDAEWGEDLSAIPDLGKRMVENIRAIWKHGVKEAMASI